MKVERRALSVMGKLERAEATELRQMRAKLSEHMDAVIALNTEFGEVSGSATVVSSDVTRAGIGRVEGEFTAMAFMRPDVFMNGLNMTATATKLGGGCAKRCGTFGNLNLPIWVCPNPNQTLSNVPPNQPKCNHKQSQHS